MKFIFALLVLAISVAASAQSRIVTIDAFDFAYSGGLLMKSDSSKGPDRDETTFRLNLNYAQKLEQYPDLMVRGRAFINKQDIDYGSADYSETRWGAALGLLINFGTENIKDAFFAGAMLGMERATYEVGSKDDESGFNLFTDLEIGKRWDLGQYSVANISYAPTFALTFKRYGGDIRDEYFKSGNEIKFNFLKFDILF